MKKTLIGAAIVALALTAGIDNSYAQRSGSGGGSGWSGGHSGGGSGWSGGHGGSGWSGGSRSGWQGRGGGWRGGGWRGGRFYGGLGLGLAIGLPLYYWGAGYYPYYDPYYYPAYAYANPVYEEAPVYSDVAPPAYTEQDPGYRYYCPNPAGYYPSVPNCSTGWMKVVPDSGPRSAPPTYQPRQ
jgi:hypothetical protein